MSSASSDRSGKSASVLTPKQIAEKLWELCRGIGQNLHEEIRSAADKMGFKLDAERDDVLWVEISQLIVWTTSFALAGDRAVLDEFHQIYLRACASSATTDKAHKEYEKAAFEDLIERFAAYDAAFKADREAQSRKLLGTRLPDKALQLMLTNGKPDQRLFNAAVNFEVNCMIFAAMKAILEFRKQFTIATVRDESN
jgi:hypothetical protein